MVWISLLLFESVGYSVCEHELRRYEKFRKDLIKCQQASIGLACVGSAFGPIGGLMGAAVGPLVLRHVDMVNDAWKDYENCVRREREKQDALPSGLHQEQELEQLIKNKWKELDDIDI